jgi:hypothetical protein
VAKLIDRWIAVNYFRIVLATGALASAMVALRR